MSSDTRTVRAGVGRSVEVTTRTKGRCEVTTERIDRLQAMVDDNGQTWDYKKAINSVLSEIQSLRAVVDKLREYDHHTTQASLDFDDGKIDTAYYDDSAAENEFAEESLSEALRLMRDVPRR